MAIVSMRDITVQYGKNTVIGGLSLEVERGENLAIVGPSSCGKTTLMRALCGFIKIARGEILLNDTVVSSPSRRIMVAPEKRNIGVVFQDYAVWPHFTVFENIVYPMRKRKVPKEEAKERALAAKAQVKMQDFADRLPSQLSGGQQQRIALARAIVTNPRVMLLDEPLSNLDPKLRESMRFEIKALQKKFNFTIIFVTHDQSEAMALSDRMLVMDLGKIIQTGTPREMYQDPANKFVYGFLGLSNFLRVRVRDGRVFPAEGTIQPIPFELPQGVSDGEGLLASRPNEIGLSRTEGTGYPGRIEKRLYMTFCIEYHVNIAGQVIRVHTPHGNVLPEGCGCFVQFRNPRWYAGESEQVELERIERQVI